MGIEWSWMTGWWAGLVIVTTFLARSLHRVISKICRPRDEQRSGILQDLISARKDAKFEIIAVPGLGAHPYHTWEARKPQGPSAADYQAAQPARVHLLKDLLARDFPEARVWNFAHDSNWLIDAPVKTTAEIGKCLLAEIKDKRSSPHLPIIFIGHSLGGMQPGQVTAQGVRRIDRCSTRQIKSEYSSPQTHSFLSTTNHDHLMGCFGLVATDDDDLTSTEDTFLTAARQCNW
ncbi:Mut11-like protein [Beauveria brongniartii RCEF 3172]|uniref:Mut11-like protein n=1 Tax=Beauveria brongniartii RCEF 3172 TaxID=1081107 RepID=A0A167VG19_9HYPO|nr:Mut11-like protein [Beauveria brongniartii RCEF 3172]